jgi:uncharacterized protein
MKFNHAIFAVFLLVACGRTTEEYLAEEISYRFPEKKGSVNDIEDLLRDEQEKALAQTIDSFRQESGKNISIIITPDFGNYSGMDQFSAALFNEWKMGENGLLIMLSSQQQSTFMEPGISTRNFLNDTICQILVDSVMIPHFSNGNYFEGLRNGVYESMLIWNTLENDSVR